MSTYQQRAQNRETVIGWDTIDRTDALRIFVAEGYTEKLFIHFEETSYTSTFMNASGYTHAKENSNDHYWRLIVVLGIWYFAIVD